MCKECDFIANECGALKRHVKIDHAKSFIQLDVCAMYPSISKTLLKEAIDWACRVGSECALSNDETNAVFSSRESLLFKEKEQWVKHHQILM